MPRRRPPEHHNPLRDWSPVWGPFVAVGIGMAVWFISQNTATVQNTSDIARLLKTQEEEAKKREAMGAEYLAAMQKEADSRQHVRDEFIAIMQKNQDALSKLNENVAVQGARYEAMVTSVNKLTEAIEKKDGPQAGKR